MTTNEIIVVLKTLADERYDEGWSFFVEAYDERDWAEFMVGITTLSDAIAKATEEVELDALREQNCRCD